MTGPEHFQRSEWLIGKGQEVLAELRAAKPEDRDALGKKVMGIWAQAQVHATLAQAALIMGDDRSTS